MSIWKYFARNSIIDEFLHRECLYYWGAVNIENCKSANNKNCYMAMCRAAKNKRHLFHVLKIRQYKMQHLTNT